MNARQIHNTMHGVTATLSRHAKNIARKRRNRRVAGFTISEILVSMSISSILLIGISSALFVASNIEKDTNSRTKGLFSAGDALDGLLRDLALATSVSGRTPTSIAFMVQDRDANSSPESIEYSWAGTPGAPLIRKYNGVSTNYVDAVDGFLLEYDTASSIKKQTVTVPGAVQDLGLLFSFESWPSVTGILYPLTMSSGYWASQFFQLDSLPSGTSKLEIYKVAVKCHSVVLGGMGNSFSMAIHRTVGGGNPEPHSNALGTPAVLSTDILSIVPTWVEANLTGVVVNNPNNNKDFSVVIKGTGNASVAINYLYSTSAPNDSPVMMWTTNGGGNWGPKKNQQSNYDMPIRVYGRITMPDTTNTIDVETFSLRAVNVSLRSGAGFKESLRSSVRTLNRPTLP